ncbi:hypothetical protein [Thalassospira profundimaris]|uniref:Uncharacterized protein n=1 Tax=Thalassospira profundimaris TaxID=502049 RepID=A0A367WXC0_9PROT|nr:hypothetical protein [Thalassospira profundimaris]RCK46093.1 hypothetical protein TH30_09690 [Thalassospira profundimaris]
MGLFSKFSSTFKKLDEAQHDYEVSLTKFPDINVPKLQTDLKLEERAQERGEAGEPPTGSTSLDAVETEIVDVIETFKRSAINTYSDQTEVLADRQAKLDFTSSVSQIDLELKEGVADFKRLIDKGLDQLHAKRKALQSQAVELKEFRKRHNRFMSADYPSNAIHVLQLAIVAVLWFVESFGNASFLAKGNELGILGAYTEAIVISTVNLVCAFMLGRAVTYINHVNFGLKFIGLLSLFTFVVGAFCLNLLVAHYRDVTGTFLDQGGLLAVQNITENPLGLADFRSWLLFAMGMLFAIVSFIDGLKWDDPYPGYGKKTRRVEAVRQDYLGEKEYHIDELESAFADAVDELKSARSALAKWRQEHSAINESRKRWHEAFRDHLDGLERSGNALLNYYREENRKARTGNAPKRFKDKWTLSRPSASETFVSQTVDKAELDELLRKAQDKIDNGILEITQLHDDGLQSYRKLDELFPDEPEDAVSNG